MPTLADLFRGAGSPSHGASPVPGVTVRTAADHWPLAVDVHDGNHLGADHDCADLSQVDPRRYPTTEYHRYRFGFVENVVEVRKRPGFRGRRISMEDTGYCLHEASLNAAFAGESGPAAAQWRERWSCLFHPKGIHCPDLHRWTSVDAWCPSRQSVQEPQQAWKPGRSAGKFRAQDVYRCGR